MKAMQVKMFGILCLLPFSLWHSSSFAKYLVEGQIEGSVCTNYIVFQTCKFVNVDAVQGDDGELFEIKTQFDNVTEENNGLCFIRLKYEGWIAWALRKTVGPTFFTKKQDGQFEKIDLEYVVFKCKKQE
jgi:hypothetical protein